MAERRRPPLILRPMFILFVSYFAVYGLLRMYGIIEARSVEKGTVAAAVGPRQDLLRWRRQFLRAIYSLPMVIEEEIRLQAALKQRQMTKMVEGEYRKATEKRDKMIQEMFDQN